METSRFFSCADCEKCQIVTTGKDPRPVHGMGNVNAEIVIVGDTPTMGDWQRKELFTGDVGSLLVQSLRLVGLSRNDTYLTTANMCDLASKPLAKDIDACLPRLEAEIASLKNVKVIIGLGAGTVRALTGKTSALKNHIGQIIWSEKWNAYVICTYHPKALFANQEYFPDYIHALKQVKTALAAPRGGIPFPDARYVESKTVAECVAQLDYLLHNVTFTSSDIETNGLDWMREPILSIGFCWDEAFSFIVSDEMLKHDAVKQKLKEVLENRNCRFLWHNGPFDTKFIWRALGIDARSDEDTMLLHYALDERKGTHGLKPLSGKYLGVPSFTDELKTYLKNPSTPWSVIPRDILYKYQAKDCAYTLVLHKVLLAELRAEPKSLLGYPEPSEMYHNLLMPATRVLAKLEHTGVLLDVGYLKKAKVEMEGQLEELEATCVAEAQNAAFEKYSVTDFNVRSPKQVSEIMFDHLLCVQTKGRSSDKEALERNKGVPFVAAVREYRNVDRLYKTYIKGFEKRLGTDGRVHYGLLLHGAVTGRLSSRDPNIQNIPADSIIKNLFIAPPGKVFVQCDYKQLEVRVAAYFSRDKELLKACTGDIHGAVSQRVFADQLGEIEKGKESLGELERLLKFHGVLTPVKIIHSRTPMEPEQLVKAMVKHLRYATKRITFGILYGLGPKALAAGLECGMHDGIEMINAFFKRYPDLTKWLKEAKKTALDNGWLETPTGRRRRFPFITAENQWKIENQAINTPIQSYASDINLMALIKLYHELKHSRVLFPVHDSIAFEIEEDHLESELRQIQETMVGVAANPYVDFLIDVEVGDSWGTIKEVIVKG